jgi:peptide-methionine (S)-S-oxide reductase
MQMDKMEKATLGGGCFWCLEAVFQDMIGVDQVVSGYAGGAIPNPTYEAVCSGRTGHAEVVQVTYDPSIVSFEDILQVFWHIHDPTTLNRQGNDVGTQYRSAIYAHDDDQMVRAQASLAAVEASDLWPKPIVTELAPLDTFYPAEAYHQNYFRNNPYQPYCQFVVNPKVQKFRKHFAEKLKK